MQKKISIAIDAMGGDDSPDKTIYGIKLFLEKNNNNTVNLIYDIVLNKKAVIKKINFSGQKIFKSRLLSSVIITEENKFWKFLSKKKYLNENQIQLDQRLLKNFYLLGLVPSCDCLF